MSGAPAVALDHDKIAILEETLGADMVAEMVKQLFQEMSSRTAALRAAGDVETIRSQGHALSALTGNFAMTRAFEICGQIRQQAPAGDMASMRALAIELSQAVMAGLEELRRRYHRAGHVPAQDTVGR